MPELPEVETVRRGLELTVRGERITAVTLRREGLRIPFPEGLARTLEARKIDAVRRRAKYLLLQLEGDAVVIAHLGMSGRLVVSPPGERAPPGKHDHLLLDFASGKRLTFNDPRRFGLVALSRRDEMERHPLLAKLGPEPLGEDFSPAYLKNALKRRSVAIKQALMDAAVVVGVGNIYASEVLFEAGVDPRTPAHKVAARAESLVDAVRAVLASALASGGSSLRDFFHADGGQGYFQHRFQVYGRAGKPCRRCAEPIRSLRQGGRSTFFCASCQR